MNDLTAVTYDGLGLGGRVIQSSSSTEAEQKLQEALTVTAAPA
jgi:uncharacterized membrane protein